MKKITLLSVIIVATLSALKGYAQSGYITTVAGNHTSGYSGDGGPATAGMLSYQSAIAIDIVGNLYIADQGNNTVRKVNNAGIITTIAGTGTAGYSGDGGPATAAELDYTQGVAVDKLGNVYIADEFNNAVRKVDVSGVISSLVGSAGAGFAGDGGLAIAAKVRDVSGVAADDFGNIYICDRGNNRIRKVDVSGIITTVAGSGSGGYGGDGGPATSAQLNSPQTVTVDEFGNMFIGDFDNNRVRKVDAAGIITTIAGNGVGGYSGDGGPATAAKICNHWGSAFPDHYGNIYIADLYNNVVRVINNMGIINTIAGTGTSGYSGDGGPATTAKLSGPAFAAVSDAGDLYISDQSNDVIRMVNKIVPPYSSGDSFMVGISKLCNGPEMMVRSLSYTPGMYVKTDFGDATTDSSIVSVGYITGGYTRILHTYNTPGSFKISQVLYRSGTAIDTIVTYFNYTFCRTLPVKLFYDDDLDGVKDGGESYMSLPSVIQVDSNGKTVDKISVTGGVNYNAYAAIGTRYSFKVITPPGNIAVSSPASGTINDTVQLSNALDKYFGLSCPSKTDFDLSVNPVVPVTGVNDQWGDIYLGNAACYPSGATVTLYFSPKWDFDAGRANPKAASISGNSATWNIPVISSNDPKPIDIYYVLWAKSSGPKLKPRDTVHSYYSVTPMTGDLDTKNNVVIRIDTVRSGCDPNAIEVTPAGCIPAGTTQLQYTIHFENTGNDTAHNIYVMDTLPNEVDPATLRLVMASANMNIGMLKNGPQNIVRFDFPLINLLDSSHHGECDGAVIFNIDLRKGLTDGTNIANHAGIFFDYNDVVMTNTINTRIGCPALHVPGVPSEQEVLIYPNPANDQLTIETVSDIYSSCNITNSIGQVLMQQPLAAARTKLNVKQLPAGLYYVTLKGDNGIKVQKFVKL